MTKYDRIGRFFIHAALCMIIYILIRMIFDLDKIDASSFWFGFFHSMICSIAYDIIWKNRK